MLRRTLVLMTVVLLAAAGCNEESADGPTNPASTLDISGDRDRGDNDACFFTADFWTHEFDAALDDTEARRRFDDATLAALLAIAALRSDIDFDRGDDDLSFSDADAVLDLHGRQSECARAEQHYFALLLNVAFNDDISIRVDTGGRDGADADLDDALGEIEESILEGECLRAKGMAERINSIGCDDECDDDDHDDDDDDDEDDEDGDD